MRPRVALRSDGETCRRIGKRVTPNASCGATRRDDVVLEGAALERVADDADLMAGGGLRGREIDDMAEDAPIGARTTWTIRR